MPTPYFDFKKFRIYHDRCAMKVGTDAVLLGSWARVEDSRNVLDIGCGSGIISLMVAQRAENANILGIDIDNEAVVQSTDNALSSPYADRVRFLCEDVKEYSTHNHNKFDCIISNPPFYDEDTLPPDITRGQARNNHTLPFDMLAKCAHELLCKDGLFHVIIPAKAEPSFASACRENGLHLIRQCYVKTTERKLAKRCLCTYSTNAIKEVVIEELTLTKNGVRSEAFKQLTNDFYLDDPQPS